MSDLAFNDQQFHQSELRHLFIPGGYGLIFEVIVAIVAMFVLNLKILSKQVLNTGSTFSADPLSLWSRIFDKAVGDTQHHAVVQEMLLFLLWAIVGALVYILIFRFTQIFLRTRSSVRQGATLVQAEHSQGAMRYLASLHDLFLKILILLVGFAALLTGALVCFGVASQELSTGLDAPFPDSLINIAISFFAALLAVRVVVIGVSLLSPRFRVWYNA